MFCEVKALRRPLQSPIHLLRHRAITLPPQSPRHFSRQNLPLQIPNWLGLEREVGPESGLGLGLGLELELELELGFG